MLILTVEFSPENFVCTSFRLKISAPFFGETEDRGPVRGKTDREDFLAISRLYLRLFFSLKKITHTNQTRAQKKRDAVRQSPFKRAGVTLRFLSVRSW